MRCVPNHLHLLLVGLALLLPGTVRAQVIGNVFGEMYLSADPEERVPYVQDVLPFTDFTFHVIAAIDFTDDGRPSDNFTNGMSAWEAALSVPAEITVTDRELLPLGASDSGTGDDNFIVDLGTTVLANSTPFTLVTYTAQVMNASVPEDLIITLGPASPSTGGTQTPSWTEAGNLQIHPFLEWSDNRFVVNCVGEDECGGSIDAPLGSLYLTASEGTERLPYNENLPAFASFTLNLVVAIDFADIGRGAENPFNGLTAWEAGLDVPADVLITGVTYYPLQSVDVQSGNDNFVVGTGTRVTAADTPAVLVELSCILPNQVPPTDLILTITGSTPSTENLDVPLWLEDLNGKFHPFADAGDRFVVNCATEEECNSTSVALSGGTVDARADAVTLSWRTADAAGNLDFSVWRIRDGIPTRVEAPVQRDGARYQVEDRGVRAGTSYRYRVEAARDGEPVDVLELAATTPLPIGVVLEQNHPNPFNPRTTLRFQLPAAAVVSVDVFDARGRWVTNLLSGQRPAGTTELVWDGTDAAGQAVGSGVYHYRLQTPDREETRRMLLLR